MFYWGRTFADFYVKRIHIQNMSFGGEPTTLSESFTQDEKPGFFFVFNSFLLIYFWLCWVFVALRGLLITVASLVVEHSSRGAG